MALRRNRNLVLRTYGKRQEPKLLMVKIPIAATRQDKLAWHLSIRKSASPRLVVHTLVQYSNGT